MNIRVADPFSPAFEKMKKFLFEPFDMGRWFNLGVGAWLAALGSGGGGLNFPTQGFSNLGQGADSSDGLGGAEAIGDFLTEHMAVIGAAFIGILVFFILLGFLLTWLSARGQFMLLDNIVYERAEVSKPWNQFKTQANSLFLFKAVYGLAAMLVFLPLLFFVLLGAVNYVNLISLTSALEQFLPASLLHITPGTTIGLVLVMVVLGFISFYITMFLDDFIVPIMYRQGVRVMDAWSKFLPILSANIGSFFLYSLFRLLIAMGGGMAVGALIVVTCFVAACFLVIPYLGAVLTLPIPVLMRGYSIHFLRQFGPAFDALAGPLGAPAGPGAPLPLEDRPPQGSGDPNNPYNPYR
jgi:hypothetical protein